MNKLIKTFRIFLIIILSIIIIFTSYLILDRNILNTEMKGISPVDIRNIVTYLIIPLTISILIIWFIEKQQKQK